jgi:hypothetical protein
MTIPLASFDAQLRHRLLRQKRVVYEAVKLKQKSGNQRASILGGGEAGGSAARDSVGTLTPATIPANLSEVR